MSDDLELPDGKSGPRPGPGLTPRDLHQNFAQSYRLKESRVANLGQSLFWHNPVPHSNYDDIKFEPKFEITNDDLINNPEMERICSDSRVIQLLIRFE